MLSYLKYSLKRNNQKLIQNLKFYHTNSDLQSSIITFFYLWNIYFLTFLFWKWSHSGVNILLHLLYPFSPPRTYPWLLQYICPKYKDNLIHNYSFLSHLWKLTIYIYKKPVLWWPGRPNDWSPCGALSTSQSHHRGPQALISVRWVGGSAASSSGWVGRAASSSGLPCMISRNGSLVLP